MPLRHNSTTVASAVADPGLTAARGTRRASDEVILDAARHLVLTQGLERTTLTDVAREAGLSRMTVYRRWSGLPELLGRMMQREWDRVLSLDGDALAERIATAPDVRGFLVDQIVHAVRALRANELLDRIITTEPHLMTPYLVERSGTMHRFARQVIANGIEYAQGGGSVRPGHPDLLATTVVLTIQSWVVSMHAGGAGQDEAQLDGELRRLLDRYLAPSPPDGTPPNRPRSRGARVPHGSEGH